MKTKTLKGSSRVIEFVDNGSQCYMREIEEDITLYFDDPKDTEEKFNNIKTWNDWQTCVFEYLKKGLISKLKPKDLR